MIKGPKKTVSVVMPLELYEQLALRAEDESRSVPGYIRQVLKCYFWHLENCPETLKDRKTVWVPRTIQERGKPLDKGGPA